MFESFSLDAINWICKKCESCHVKYNRDPIGGENIARIRVFMLLYGSRPAYLPMWPGRLKSNSNNSSTSSTKSTVVNI